MLLNKKSVELLAPAGNYETFLVAVDAGADAIYLGGKHFNMRRLKADANFDNETLKKAVEYAHTKDVYVYVTINNLISDEEIPELQEYLKFLAEIKVDAVLIQDLAVAQIVRELGLDLTMHASIMMNSHNNAAIKKLKEYGIRRVVVSREMSLKELSELKAIDDDFELEYFVHGDMCIAESGQCIHSGVVFANSSNRGRCMKSCRWPYKIIDEETKTEQPTTTDGDYRLALKDMCMYRNIPDLIQAGVLSFKIEGRMRDAEFVRRIVSIYRKAIDAYIADPNGYQVNEEDWQTLYDNRVRDFSTCFAMDKPDEKAIGYTGEREPRFFSYATKEAGLDARFVGEGQLKNNDNPTKLVVKVPTVAHAKVAMEAGANILIVGGEVYRPNQPWSLKAMADVVEAGAKYGCEVIVNTPRTTLKEQCGELEILCKQLEAIKPMAIMAGNLGSATIIKENTDLNLFADHSFNIFNHVAVRFLKENGMKGFTPSYELGYDALKELVNKACLPSMVTVHGAVEAMISDSNIAAMNMDFDPLANPEFNNRHFALLDTVGGVHSMRMDQYHRVHILFAHDLCLLPIIEHFKGADMWRIEAQDYSVELTGYLTKVYRAILDGKPMDHAEVMDKLIKLSPRPLGIGAYRHQKSL